MDNFKGKDILSNITDEDLLKLGLENISILSESSWKPKIIFRYINGRVDEIEAENNDVIIETIENYPIIKRFIRRKKLDKLK